MANKKRASSSNDDLFSAEELLEFKSGQTATGAQTPASSAAGVPSAQKSSTGEQLKDLIPGGSSRQSATTIDTSSYAGLYSGPSAEKTRFAMDKRARNTVMLLILLLVVYAIVVILPTDLFVQSSAESFLSRFSTALTANVEQTAKVLTGVSSGGFSYSHIIIYALVVFVGAALATCGAAYQGCFRNDLATPSTLGVMSGASLGMVIYLVNNTSAVMESRSYIALNEEQAAQIAAQTGSSGVTMTDFSFYLSQSTGIIYSLVGALIVVALTVIISKIAGKGKISNVGLIIAGQVFSAVAGSVVTLYRLMLVSSGGQAAATALGSLQTGDLSSLGNTYDLLFFGLPILVCIVILCLSAPRMNALAFGMAEAKTMGIRTSLLRGVIIAVSTLMTAIVVAYCGSIGFVGFLIPHMVRRIVGPDFRYLLPASALAGGAFVLVVFYGYSCLTNYQGGIGLVTTCVGAVVFIAAIVKRRRIPNAQ